MKKVCSLLLLTCCFTPVFSQPYVDGGKTRHRFAQLNFGLDGRVFPTGGAHTFFRNSSGAPVKRALENHTEVRLIIGGTHFWGHADFYMAFPVVSAQNSGFHTSVETGTHFFPWRIERQKLRPFLGAAWSPQSYQQGEGVQQLHHTFPLTAGLVFLYKQHLFQLQAGYNFQNTYRYYISPGEKIMLQTPPLWVGIGYKLMLETTLSAEKDWKTGKTQVLTDTLARLGRLNGLTLSAGPSSAFFLRRSPHNQAALPFLNDHRISNVFPEFGIGYYLHRPDIQFNLLYRNIHSRLEAYGYTQTARRRALTLEAFMFLFDYHGFAAFAGGAVSREWLELREQSPAGEVQQGNNNTLSGGLVLGWDIRPNRLQSWYLRTSLRWFPGLKVDMYSGKSLSLEQLEVNFIQLVIFPGRMF